MGLFVKDCFKWMKGGEIFVPKIKSIKTTDLARNVINNCGFKLLNKARRENT